eukprot:TRINITY_DN57509_c0_g2_i2.p1 TRINITY_DN57509_c0_g2~~TRINITY_DN57509_c0_g2_i2.p1  ORF type:complete len:117 (-),score=12.80 TRINITY_DN57509_c0_g2_i2:73-423(-)
MFQQHDEISFKDLQALGTSSGNKQIMGIVQTIRINLMEHVHKCTKGCKGRAFQRCPSCSSEETLPIWDTDKASVCSGCFTAYHKMCLDFHGCKTGGCAGVALGAPPKDSFGKKKKK